MVKPIFFAVQFAQWSYPVVGLSYVCSAWKVWWAWWACSWNLLPQSTTSFCLWRWRLQDQGTLYILSYTVKQFQMFKFVILGLELQVEALSVHPFGAHGLYSYNCLPSWVSLDSECLWWPDDSNLELAKQGLCFSLDRAQSLCYVCSIPSNRWFDCFCFFGSDCQSLGYFWYSNLIYFNTLRIFL